MAFIIDLMENPVARYRYERGFAQGFAQGLATEIRKILRAQLKTSFHRLPRRAKKQLDESTAEIEASILRVLDPGKLEDALSKR